MLMLPPAVQIYLASQPVDLRKGFDALAGIVRSQWGEDVYAGHLFVFVSRRGDRVKALFFDGGGLVLYHKRLERGRFCVPAMGAEAKRVRLDATQLTLLLDGIDMARVARPARWQPPATSWNHCIANEK